jgi:hypothetical protein
MHSGLPTIMRLATPRYVVCHLPAAFGRLMASCCALQAQILLDIQQKFVNSTACLHLGRWEDAEVSSWNVIFG